jgi:hypothetical protein
MTDQRSHFAGAVRAPANHQRCHCSAQRSLPEKIPDGGLIILRDGDPGEPETLLSRFLITGSTARWWKCCAKRRSSRPRSRARRIVPKDFTRHRGRPNAWRTLRPHYAASAGQQRAGGRRIAADQRRDHPARTYLRHSRSARLNFST